MEEEDSSQSNKRKRKMPLFGKKRGPKPGSKRSGTKTKEEWFRACQVYSNLPLGENKKRMAHRAFLQSELTPDSFTGTLSETQSFARYLKKYDDGELVPSTLKRQRTRSFEPLEKKIVEYLQESGEQSWGAIREKALAYALELGFTEFKASDGWISTTLERHDLQHVVKYNRPPPSFATVKDHFEDLRKFCRAHQVPASTRALLCRLKNEMQDHYQKRVQSEDS